MMNTTFYMFGDVVIDRQAFARVLAAARGARLIRSYGRLNRFGRSLIMADGSRVLLRDWTAKPSMNIHR